MPKTKPKYFWVICSIAGVLTSIGIAFIAFVFVYQSLAQAAQKQVVLVDIEAEASQESILTIQNFIVSKGYALDQAIQFDSSEAIIEHVNSLLGYETSVAANPQLLESVIRFELAEDFKSESAIQDLQYQLEQLPDVVMAFVSPQENIGNIKRSILILTIPVLILGLIMLGIALSLIYGAVKLHMHTNRFTIKTMQLVGAKPEFVLKPYSKRARLNAFYAFAISLLLLSLLTFSLTSLFPWLSISDHIFSSIICITLLGILAFAISHWSTKRAVKKYLSTPIDQLY